MGCCISSAQEPNSHPFQKSNTTHLTILEEETIVKEVVISETPNIPKLPLPDSPQSVKSPIPRSPESSIDSKGSEKEEEIELSLSGVSDFLSFSAIDESVSTSTATTVTMRREKNEEDEVVGPPVYALRKKSFSGEFSGERPGRIGLPENRRRLVVPVRGNVGPQRRRVPPAPVARRRTNLPGTGGSGDGDRRIVEKDVTGKTGAPGYRSVGASATSVKSRRVVEDQNDTVSYAVVESLENPLVSLECFIFL